MGYREGQTLAIGGIHLACLTGDNLLDEAWLAHGSRRSASGPTEW